MPFNDGDNVRLKGERDRVGRVVGQVRQYAGKAWRKVQFPDGQVENHPEDSLELYAGPQDVETLLCSGTFGTRKSLTRLLTIRKIQRPLSNNVYSFQASRTAFYPHQLKPVLKFLESPKNRLLIADEVGLGKTIEAGLIIVEERARHDLRRVLIVCPSALRQKWQREMKQRFDEEFEILDSQGFRRFLADFEEHGEATQLRGIVSIQSIRAEDLVRDLEHALPQLDLVIVDEAHHLRNPETLSHAAGRALSDCADAMLLLTATPVHLGNQNLFSLLQLLDAEEFDEFSAFSRRLAANEHVIRAQRLLARDFPADLSTCVQALRAVETSPERRRFAENPIYADVIRRFEQYDGGRRDHVIELQRAVASLNLLGHVFTRTRKVEVHETKPQRTPYNIAKPFSPRESAFYREVTEFAQDWYLRRQMGGLLPEPLFQGQQQIESFAAMMLQRQAASSLPALIEQTLSAGEPLVDPEEEASDDEMPPAAVLQNHTLSLKQDPNFRYLVSQYQDLENEDSKYASLVAQLRSLDAEEPGRKAIVFSFFKGTLRYLHRRLADDGFTSVVVHGDVPSTPNRPETDERGRRFERFQHDPTVRILLSSEVGGEGLDLQFCHIVFNYDLPWNPMVVEQRIGRLDRFGQKSERILIFNFFAPETIEDRILRRLYDRIQIFQQSIGDLEPILGGEIQQLERELLTSRLTPAEQTQRAQQVEMMLERRKQEVAELEQVGDRLIGQDEYFREELGRVQALGRFVTPGELEMLIRDFLKQHHPRAQLKPASTPGVMTLEVSDDLYEFVRKRSVPSEAGVAAFLARASRGTVAVTFASERAFENSALDFLTIHHPLVKAVATHYRTDSSSMHAVARVAMTSAAAPSGRYLFLVYLLEVKGLRNLLQFLPVFVNVATGARLTPDQNETLLSEIVAKGRTMDGVPDLSPDVLRRSFDQADAAFSDHLSDILDDLRRSNEALIANRLSTVEASFAAKLSRQRRRLSTQGRRTLDPRYVRMIEGTIRRLEMELQARRREIEAARRVEPLFDVLAGGVVDVAAP
jgi:superfamily II DNA or RNA helicase